MDRRNDDRDAAEPIQGRAPPRARTADIDGCSLDSFPASDAPSWTPVTRVGHPVRKPDRPVG